MGNRMSMSVTPQEEVRVQILASLGMKLDPRQSADLIMVIVIAIAYCLTLVAVVFMLWNRKYPPIKAKNPMLMTCVYVASVLWFTGEVVVNGHAPIKGTPLERCRAFGIWVHLLLGVCAVSSLIGLRSYGLYCVFYRSRPYRGFVLYFPFVLTAGLLLVYGIIAQSISESKTVHYVEGVDVCTYEVGYKVALFSLVWVTWVIVALLNWRIRNIKSSFNESREIIIACAVVFGVLLHMTILSYTRPNYPLNVAQRIRTTSLSHLCAFSVWWSIMAVPLLMCLVRRKAYLESWMQKLRNDGLQRVYNVDSGVSQDVGGAGGGGGGVNSHSYINHSQGSNQHLAYVSSNHKDCISETTEGAAQLRTSDISIFQSSPTAKSDGMTLSPIDATKQGEIGWSPVQVHSQPAAKWPWNNPASASNHQGAASFATNSNSPISPSSPAAIQPYTQIINFPEPVVNSRQHRPNTGTGHGLQLDQNGNLRQLV
ncbi:hypothetical protein GGI20_004873 [Coemansia sp. BCRC 34301]|nr:hypothetical protein GGI20_004873 [Coemansia sp. BCRC 34301]